MTQGTDSNGHGMQAFSLPTNGNTEIIVSATGAIVNTVAAPRSGFYEFLASADCFIAVGLGTATIPVALTSGGIPLKAGVAKAYHLTKGDVVSAIGAAAFNLYMSKV